MAIEGELHVGLRCSGGRTEAVSVRSTRPFVAQRLLVGRTVAEACSLVPALFSICGRSQGIAAALACEAALAIDPVPARDAARAWLIAGEAMQESTFQMLVEWPRLLGEPEAIGVVAAARRRIGAATAPVANVAAVCAEACGDDALDPVPTTLREAVSPLAAAALGCPPGEWNAGAQRSAVEPWAEAGGTAVARCVRDALRTPDFGASDVSLLPSADDGLAAAIAGEMDADGMFEQTPHWRGVPVETGALARQANVPSIDAWLQRFGRSALVRSVARLFEVVAFVLAPQPGRLGRLALDRGEGLGWVETARGLLLHRVRVQRDRIAAYRIVAPTEWNFHPDGALARGLRVARLTSAATAERAVRLLVQSLDPCVSVRVEVAHA